MRWLAEARERLGALLHRAREEAEMDEELRFHLEMQAEEYVRAGMSPEEAHRRARLDFGGVEGVREEVREARGLGRVETVARDARYALRGLRLNPTFAVTLVLTLGLGVGAAAAMFSVLDALLLRPLPFHEPGRLVEVRAVSREGATRPYVDWAAARAWGEEAGVFEGVLAHVRESLLFTGGPEPTVVMVEGVTPDFEEVLGVRPALGRGLYPEDADPGAPSVVVLDHAFWRRAFGADPGVIGRSVELEGRPHRVVGVMPEGFRFPTYASTELWMPIRADGTFLGAPARGIYLLGRVGRAPLAVAQARADAASRALDERQPREQGWSVQLQPLSASRGGNPQLRQSVWFLAGAVALLLLVAAVNATALLLVRGWSRTRELAVRVALGASRRRVVGQLMVESVVLSLLAGAVAAVLAQLALRAVGTIVPDEITFFAPYAIELEWRALVFTFGVAAVLGALVGVVPALRATRPGRAEARPGLAAYARLPPDSGRLRRALVVGEVALSVMLLIGAGLLVHSFVRLTRVDPGFQMDGLAVMWLGLSESTYPTGGERAEFLRRLEQRIEAIPGVEGVALADGVPPAAGFRFGIALEAEGRPPPRRAQPQLLPVVAVPPDFFPVLGVPVVAGRPFTAEDAGTDAVIIDRGLARFLWGDADPVGRRFRTDPQSPWLTVVGLVRDLRMMGPDDRQGGFEMLRPLGRDEAPPYVPLAIRTRGDPRPLLPAVRRAVHALDPRQPVEALRPAAAAYAEAVAMPRFLLVLLSTLAGLALLLASVGIYGVLASGVAQRRRELGIRMALGAPLRRVWWGVLREGLLLAVAGVAAGTAAALALSRLVAGLLYGVEPTDPTALVTVVGVSLLSAALACYAPARRATRLDPVEVLRAE